MILSNVPFEFLLIPPINIDKASYFQQKKEELKNHWSGLGFLTPAHQEVLKDFEGYVEKALNQGKAKLSFADHMVNNVGRHGVHMEVVVSFDDVEDKVTASSFTMSVAKATLARSPSGKAECSPCHSLNMSCTSIGTSGFVLPTLSVSSPTLVAGRHL